MTLFASREDRTIRGLLLPFGEASRLSVSGAEPVMFSAGTVKLPRSVKHLNANIGHDRYTPVASFESVEETERGLEATFNVADSDEGDDLFAAIDSGRLTRLSAEVRSLVRKGAAAVSAVLTGAAFVEEGAFESAALFAIGDVTEVTDPPAAELDTSLAPDEEGHLAVLSTGLPEDIRVTTPEGEAATYIPEPTPAEENPTATESDNFAMSIVPDTAGVQTPAVRDDLNALFSAVATRTPEALAPFSTAGDLFAIANIQDSGPSGVTIGADVRQPQALAELWTRRPYDRKFVPLFNHQDLTSTRAYGWRWVEGKTPQVDDYAGNLAEVPSNALDTEPVTADAARLAGGHKIDRRFIDFKDQAVIESYLRLQTEDYARKSDGKALGAAVAGATAGGIGAAVTGVDDSLVAVVDGALNVIGSENTPSFAVVSPELWRKLILTPKDKVFEFLNAGFGLEEGSTAGFRIIPGAVGTGKVLVGAKEAMTFFELPGAPIRVEGLDVHHGGVDLAVFGYYASIVNNAKALSLVNTVRA